MACLLSYKIALGARGSIWNAAMKSNTAKTHVMWRFPGRISIGTFPSEDMLWPVGTHTCRYRNCRPIPDLDENILNFSRGSVKSSYSGFQWQNRNRNNCPAIPRNRFYTNGTGKSVYFKESEQMIYKHQYHTDNIRLIEIHNMIYVLVYLMFIVLFRKVGQYA